MPDTLVLEAREVGKTKHARAARKAGKVPGILYGRGAEPVAFEVDDPGAARRAVGRGRPPRRAEAEGAGPQGRHPRGAEGLPARPGARPPDPHRPARDLDDRADRLERERAARGRGAGRQGRRRAGAGVARARGRGAARQPADRRSWSTSPTLVAGNAIRVVRRHAARRASSSSPTPTPSSRPCCRPPRWSRSRPSRRPRPRRSASRRTRAPRARRPRRRGPAADAPLPSRSRPRAMGFLRRSGGGTLDALIVGLGNPGRQYAGHAPQHRLQGRRPAGGAGRCELPRRSTTAASPRRRSATRASRCSSPRRS